MTKNFENVLAMLSSDNAQDIALAYTKPLNHTAYFEAHFAMPLDVLIIKQFKNFI